MSKSTKKIKWKALLLSLFLVFGFFGGFHLWKQSQIQVIPVTAYMDEETLDLQDTVLIKTITDENREPVSVKEGHLYQLTIRYAIDGIYGDWAVYGCSDMQTVTTFIARREIPQVKLTTAFDSAKITDGDGNSFDPDTMTLTPFITIEEA